MSDRNVFREIQVLRIPLASSCEQLSIEDATAQLWDPVRNPIMGSELMVRFQDYQSLLDAHASMLGIAEIRSEEIERLRKRIGELGG